ncbi:hypothetical protein ACPUEN_01405 [Algoriphagus yeomjeoni]|uniref:hypothetical protein n=1 Tax=Algoriphagus yeomjeoni TaxID=291403 RepID=UPI003CE4A58C
MKKLINPIFLCCLLISVSCTENEDPAMACGVSDPIENLPWLKQMAENASSGGLSEFAYIAKAKYKGKRVFYLGSCCPNCSWALILYDCERNTLTDEIGFDDLEDTKVIWQTSDNQCAFSG